MIFLRASKKSHCWDRTSTAIATSLRRITTGVYQTVRPKKGAVWVRTRCSVEDLKRSTSYRVEAGGSAISWIKCLGSTQTWESASLLHIRRIFQMRYWLDEFICLCFWIDGFFFLPLTYLWIKTFIVIKVINLIMTAMIGGLVCICKF